MNEQQPTAPAPPFAAQLEAVTETAKEYQARYRDRVNEILGSGGTGWDVLNLYARTAAHVKRVNDEYHFAHWLAERGIRPPVDNDDWAALALYAGVPDERDPAQIARAAMARHRELGAVPAAEPPAAEAASAPEVPAQPEIANDVLRASDLAQILGVPVKRLRSWLSKTFKRDPNAILNWQGEAEANHKYYYRKVVEGPAREWAKNFKPRHKAPKPLKVSGAPKA